jgi:glutamine synthetase
VRPVKAVRLLGQDWCCSRRRRQLRPAGPRLPAPRRRPGLWPQRGRRPALPLPRLEVRRRRPLPDTPAEPTGSTLCQRMRQRSYPVLEKAGVLFAWLGARGARAPPPFPAFDCFAAPATHSFAFKGLWNCNWLQAFEVGIDPAHASFLHRFFFRRVAEESYGRQFRGASAGRARRPALAHDAHDARVRPARHQRSRTCRMACSSPRCAHQRPAHPHPRDQRDLPAHLRDSAVRDDDHHPDACAGGRHAHLLVRVLHQLRRAAGQGGHAQPAAGGRHAARLHPQVGPHNNWGFSAEEQRSRTYLGMGEERHQRARPVGLESMGAIQDRTREHLGTSDKVIMANRRNCSRRSRRCRPAARRRAWPIRKSPRTAWAPTRWTAWPPPAAPAWWRHAVQAKRDNAPWDAALKPVAEPLARVLAARGSVLKHSRCGMHDDAREAPRCHTARLIEASGLELVRFGWCDLHGVLRGKTLTAKAAAVKALRAGVGMVSTLLLKDTSDRTAFKVFEPGGTAELPGFAFASNLMLLPDPASFKQLPWAQGTGWLRCQPWFQDGTPVPLDTRRMLQLALAKLAAAAGFGMVCGLEVEFHIYRIKDNHTARPGPRAGRLARPAARGQHDPPRLQPAGRELDRHGRGAAAHRAAHRAGAGPAAAVAGDRTGPEPGRGGVRRHRRADRRRQHGAVSQRRAPGAAPRGLPRQLHVPPALSQHHVQRLAPAPVAGGRCHGRQRLHARRARTRQPRRRCAAHAVGHRRAPGWRAAGPRARHGRFCTPTVNGFGRFRPNALAPQAVLWGRDNRGAMLRVVGGAGDGATRIENRIGEPRPTPTCTWPRRSTPGWTDWRAG